MANMMQSSDIFLQQEDFADLPELVVFPIDEANPNQQIKLNFAKFECCSAKDKNLYTGEIVIVYEPNDVLVEFDSLIEYFQSFKNNYASIENVISQIADDFYEACEPAYFQICGKFKHGQGLEVEILIENDELFSVDDMDDDDEDDDDGYEY